MTCMSSISLILELAGSSLLKLPEVLWHYSFCKVGLLFSQMRKKDLVASV